MGHVFDIVEIDIERCGLTYGIGACTAALGVTGEIKCYNSLRTCQDTAHFDSDGAGGEAGTLATWRFAKPSEAFAASGIDAITTIESIAYTPQTIHPGEGPGQRATLTVTLSDHHWGDTGPNGDKYRAERGHDPFKRGTFWGKWRARQPYMRGRAIRWKQGLDGQPFAGFDTRHFIIERFDGPTPEGLYTITARDALQELFGDRAVCPELTPGNLVANIAANTTSVTLAPAGVGDAYYDASGWVNLGGREIAAFSRAGNVLTLTRGLWGTTAQAHEAGTRVQLCAAFISDTPAEALARLETQYAAISPDVIPLAEWESEIEAFYGGALLTALVPEPTPVEHLATEIIREVGLSHWWSERTARLRLQVLRALDTNVTVLDARNAPGESNVIANSLQITEQPDKRKSRAQVYFGQRNPIEGLEPKNLPISALHVATFDEKAEGSKRLDVLYSRWIQSGGLAAADVVALRRLARYVRAPRRFKLRIPRWTSLRPELGQGCRLLADVLQDETGAPESVPCQIVRVNPGAADSAEYELELEELRMDPRFAPEPLQNTVVLAANENNVNFYAKYIQQYRTPEAGDEVFLVINEGVVIGSTSTANPSLDIGDDWPRVTRTASRTNGNATLTGLSSTTGFLPGMFVTGTGIPARAKIVSVNSGSSITISANATSTGSGTITIWTVRIKVTNRGLIAGPGGRGANGRGGDNNTGFNGNPGGTGLRTTVPFDLDGNGGINGGGGGGGGGAGDYVGWTGPQVHGASGGGGAGMLPGEPGTGPGPIGSPGTLLAGGAGRRSSPSSQGWGSGDGGGPGQAGSNGYGYRPGSGGAAGPAVVGWTLIATTGWTGTILGATNA
ncbi:hypothetical protein EMQ25_05750 [Arsenicitalea aurantiaca]|uniref:Uncharacterized protein n=1 Tax=Arsenicitalea aurantiaca TaxID=1783274 RepID=A0A433XEW8_9HYPH|nr:hypothetical protein [Arsenicitalea aurantiaca]RUT32649.1 hypothetical protein EMQ25_05750 [Arsenicitalea aurantiaca]